MYRWNKNKILSARRLNAYNWRALWSRNWKSNFGANWIKNRVVLVETYMYGYYTLLLLYNIIVQYRFAAESIEYTRKRFPYNRAIYACVPSIPGCTRTSNLIWLSTSSEQMFRVCSVRDVWELLVKGTRRKNVVCNQWRV